MERNIARNLFGKDNLKNDTRNAFASNPLVLFCKHSNDEEFEGTNVTGYDFKFCNTTETVQTDVGLCIADNTRHRVPSSKKLKKKLKTFKS